MSEILKSVFIKVVFTSSALEVLNRVQIKWVTAPNANEKFEWYLIQKNKTRMKKGRKGRLGNMAT